MIRTGTSHETSRGMLRLGVLTAVVAAGFTLWAVTSTLAQSQASRSTRKPQSKELQEKDLLEKIDAVLANQTQILSKFDDIMEELAIIKVRSSL